MMPNVVHLCFLLSVLCLLTACGFHPIYATRDSNTPVAQQLNQIAIDNIPERQGQILRNKLIDKMYGKGRPTQPLYKLSVKLRVSEEELGIQANATSTRTFVNMYGDYTLTDNQGRDVLKGTSHSVTNFNRLADQYGSLAARQSAIERTLNEISEQMVNRLSLYFSEKSSTP
jgi:LPS-assembly lipoprotein